MLGFGIELSQVLMRKIDRKFVLARLFEYERDIFIDIILALVDIEKCWRPLLFRNWRAFECGLGNHGDEEAAEDLRAVLFEQVLRR